MRPALLRLARLAAAALALLAFSSLPGCAARRIGGTQIPDNSDTRAIVALIDAYRQAAERRDAPAVMGLVSPHYADDSGTPDPSDDVDAARLAQRLTADYAQVAAQRLSIAVRRIDVQGDHAEAFVFYDATYRIVTRAGEVTKNASDLHRFRFVREQGTWKFLSGL